MNDHERTTPNYSQLAQLCICDSLFWVVVVKFDEFTSSSPRRYTDIGMTDWLPG